MKRLLIDLKGDDDAMKSPLYKLKGSFCFRLFALSLATFSICTIILGCNRSFTDDEYYELAVKYERLLDECENLENSVSSLQSELDLYNSIKSVEFDENLGVILFCVDEKGIAVCDFDGANIEREFAIIMGATTYFRNQNVNLTSLYNEEGESIGYSKEDKLYLNGSYNKFDMMDSTIYEKYSEDLTLILS